MFPFAWQHNKSYSFLLRAKPVSVFLFSTREHKQSFGTIINISFFSFLCLIFFRYKHNLECPLLLSFLRLHVTTWYKGTYERKWGNEGCLSQIPLLAWTCHPAAGSLLSKQQPAASSFSIFPTINSRPAWGHVLPRNTASLSEPGGNKDLPNSPWHGCSDSWHSPQRASGYPRHPCTYINAPFPKCVDPDKYLSPWTSCQNLLLENLTCEGK